MLLKSVYIKGFRNFKEATINFEKQTLVIGANDIGKTNLMYALRILLDRNFSDSHYVLDESDFCVYDDQKEIIIRAYFEDVIEDVLLARLKGIVNDDGKMVLQYNAYKEGLSVNYKFSCGPSDKDEDLKEYEMPFYKRFLNIKYIGGKRDFWSYIEKMKLLLLQKSKVDREDEQIEADEKLYNEIKGYLELVDRKIPDLHYVKNATDKLNDEMNKLSLHNKEQSLVFDTSTNELDAVIKKVKIVSKHEDKKLLIGGDGRLSQIYLSLWTYQNQPSLISNEVSIICIEEPEVYLHPHQQRELAAYLASRFNGQVVLTSHSPFIVCQFSPNSIIRLYKPKFTFTEAASDGCSQIIESQFKDFGYRMSVIPAEAFFADYVVLVEGPSEKIFYQTLAKQLDISLDQLNISILDVEGVSFNTYIGILDALHIKWTMRTDNDIMKIPKKNEYRFAGIERGVSCLKQNFKVNNQDEKILNENLGKIKGFENKDNVSEETKAAAIKLINLLQDNCIYIAKEDLETDLYEGPLQEELKRYYGKDLSKEEIINRMKAHKAVHMYEFLKEKKETLKCLADDEIAAPLLEARSYLEKAYGAD